MQFRLTSEQDKPIFEGWNSSSRLEERTCRPIINGKRATPADHVVALTFFQDEIDNPEPVGRFMYFDVNPRNRSAEFGYIVSPEHRQRRIGTKMLTQSMDHVFSTTSLNKLYCQTAAFNVASIKLLEMLGFHKDGILREHHELDGTLWDDIIYSILRCEWVKR